MGALTGAGRLIGVGDRMEGQVTSGSEMPAAGKKRLSRRKVALIAALALVLAGGAVATVTAVGEGSKHARHARGGVVGRRDLAAASAYLGVSEEQLASELRSGISLAQVANSTPGRSSAGLVAALVTAKRERLSTLGASVQQRVANEVHRSGPNSVRTTGHRARTGLGGLSSGFGRLGRVAASYLGVSPARLQSELRSGRTLAQVAGTTPGRSAIGLINALVKAKRESISSAVGARRLAAVRARAVESRLMRRVTEFVTHPLS
jgi:hypothetical protein